MTTYTAEDFASAKFARHRNGSAAARVGVGSRPWYTPAGWASDAEMVDRGWEPVRETTNPPITLDALHAAWENAEVADEGNEGDILALRHPASPNKRVTVWVASRPGPLSPYTRILHRAPKPKPKREPWQDLADVLRAHTGEPDPEETAKMLHERGVRVTEEMSAEYA